MSGSDYFILPGDDSGQAWKLKALSQVPLDTVTEDSLMGEVSGECELKSSYTYESNAQCYVMSPISFHAQSRGGRSEFYALADYLNSKVGEKSAAKRELQFNVG